MQLFSHAAIMRLMAFALPIALLIAWVSGCSESTVQTNPNRNQPGVVSVHGSAFDVTLDAATWKSAKITIRQTLVPNGSVAPENSFAFNEPFTSGKIVVTYTDASGKVAKRMEQVRIDNTTRRIFRGDDQVSTVGQLFAGLEIPVTGSNPHLYFYYDYPVLMEVDPADDAYVFEGAISFSNAEPGVVEPEPQDSAKVYKTDSGRTVTTEDDHYPREPDVSDSVAKEQLRRWGLLDSVKQTGKPTDSTNCAGWVFTCGKKWMPDSGDVWKIIKDNGYKEVTDPKPGDIVIYKDAQGRITHIGIVRADGMIESKWGRLGRYLHKPHHVPPGYGKPCYYRSDRKAPDGSTDPEKDRHTLK